MRQFYIIFFLAIIISKISYTQKIEKLDSIKIDTVINLKRFSFGIKMGLPNILGLTTEAVLPIFKNRVSPYFDFSSFKLNPDKTSIDLNYTDFGVNIYVNSKGNGLYASLGSGNLSSLILFQGIELTDENGNKGLGNAQLKENIGHFKKCAIDAGLLCLPSDSPIQPIICSDNHNAVDISEKLHQLGFCVVAIRPPTVPVGTSRLRVTLSAVHSRQQITELVAAIAVLMD